MAKSQISRASLVQAVIQAACRRRLAVLALEQLAIALALVLGGGVLMLLLGTQILHWYWLALLAIAGLALAYVRMRDRALPPYRIAQIVDRRLELSDSLSTAWFLLSTAKAPEDPIARFQIRHAESIARSVKPSRAFPFTGRRTWALAGGLALVVFGLFAVRYLVTRSLNLEQALVPMHFGAAFEVGGNSLSAENHAVDREALTEQSRGQSQNISEKDGAGQASQGQDFERGNQEGMSAGQAQTQPAGTKPDNTRDEKSQSRGAKSSNAEQNSGASAQAGSANRANSERSRNANEQSADGQQESSGLIDKMRDALSSLMAKMRPNQSLDKRSQAGDRTSDEPKAGEQAAAKGQAGQQPDARNEQARQDQNSDAQAQSQTTERAQASQGRNADQAPDKGSDAHSGIGRQDGDKDLKEAEQLQAMGKLAEIIGKRSASLTGDMMVESSSGKQQLKTAYSQRLGHHLDLGGEINRDEIPLADQQYIREYMELVRKQAKGDH